MNTHYEPINANYWNENEPGVGQGSGERMVGSLVPIDLGRDTPTGTDEGEPIYLTKDIGRSELGAMRAVLHSFVFLLLAATLGGAEPALKVSFVDKTLTFTPEEFSALPHIDLVALDAHAQKEHNYTGVSMHELLARAGVPLGEKLRGAALQLVVVLHSRDGYAVSYAVAEFDDAFSNRALLLAEKEDGKPLAENAAPFRLIAPGDKKGARWARMVNWIEVVSAGTPSIKTKS